MPTPYYLTPKATKLPEGHDDSLDPPEPPTHPEERSRPPTDWPVASAARGGSEPPEGPLAPPPTPPARRILPPFRWPMNGGGIATPPNRPLAETPSPLFDLDPDIAMWPVTILQRWPFTGPPTVGVWPRGWLGADNTATLYICTVGGEPGTWAAIGTGSTGPPGPAGPAGPTGAQGPAGPGVILVGQSITTGNFGGIGTGLSAPLASVEVNGTGAQRFTIAIGGTFTKGSADTPGTCTAYLVRSDNPTTALASTVDSVAANGFASFFTEASDLPPPTSLSYWLLATTSAGAATILSGARLMVWQSG